MQNTLIDVTAIKKTETITDIVMVRFQACPYYSISDFAADSGQAN